MKKWCWIGMVVFLMGCESVPVEKNIVADPGVMSHRFASLSALKIGMNRSQVNDALGKEVVVGYTLADPGAQAYQPITAGNPLRSEIILRNSKYYAVDYYRLGIKTPDDRVTDDELIPLVFFEDRLIGSGWDYLNHQIRGN